MEREICLVQGIDEANLTLNNTKGEQYIISNEYNNGYKQGSKVLLLYTERARTEDGWFTAKVKALYPFDFPRIKPVK